jgi:hypothetical protein
VEMLKYIKWLHCIAGVLCFLFFFCSDGLVFYSEEGNTYESTKTLQSSGSDDDVAVFAIGCICILTALLLILSKSLIYNNVTIVISTLLQLFSMMLIQMGNISATIFIASDIYLIGVFILQVVILTIITRENVRVLRQL